jgi:hypothetical protein
MAFFGLSQLGRVRVIPITNFATLSKNTKHLVEHIISTICILWHEKFIFQSLSIIQEGMGVSSGQVGGCLEL